MRSAGHYILAPASLPLADLSDGLRRKLPRCEAVPAIHMGRLAVDTAFKGQGLGTALPVDALRRATSIGIAAAVLIVDAKDDLAAAFYLHHGFTPLADRRSPGSCRWFLPDESAPRKWIPTMAWVFAQKMLDMVISVYTINL